MVRGSAESGRTQKFLVRFIRGKSEGEDLRIASAALSPTTSSIELTTHNATKMNWLGSTRRGLTMSLLRKELRVWDLEGISIKARFFPRPQGGRMNDQIVTSYFVL